MTTIQAQRAAYRASLGAAKPFDCNVWWAPLQEDGFRTYPDFSSLLGSLEALGICGGIVTDAQAASFDNYTGNERLRELLPGHPGWYGAMVLTPDILFDGGAGAYLKQMIDGGFRAVRMFPKTYAHSMAEYAIGPLLEQMADLGLPLMVWHDQVSWEEMDRILTAHPRLNLIVEAHDMKLLYHAREYFALMRRHDNFYLESHNLVLPLELENLWELCGKMHVVFGTYFPYANPHFAAYRALNAAIPEEARAELLSGNAGRLFPQRKEAGL